MIPPQLINFFSNHFELLIIVNFIFLTVFLTMRFLLSIRDLRWGQLFDLINQGIFYVVVFAQICLMIISGYVYWVNYEQKSKYTLSDVLEVSTVWVRDKITIYFIDDNELWSIDSKGRYKARVYQAKTNIKEYHFSPDGKKILILTENRLVLLNRKDSKTKIIDSIQLPDSDVKFKGSLGNVHWAPDGQKFTYAISRWSPFSSQNNTYVYFVRANTKEQIKNPARKIPELFWGREAGNLYYFTHTALDSQEHGYPFDVRIFKISLSDLKPVLVAELPSQKPELTADVLATRNIFLFDKQDELSFGQTKKEELVWVSDKGSRVGIDEEDHLYYVANRWWRKRLFYVTRDPLIGDMKYYHHRGKLSIRHLQWLPSGRYIILSHSTLGILILEPKTGRIGQLIQSTGATFGWYEG